jgi:hypothetical protein
MPRSSSGPFGTLQNLSRLCRAALVIDGILATGRRWEEIAREVRETQYEARGYAPPRSDVVRRYFSLELAPALDPGFKAPLGYPAALALQYPEVRPMVIAPLLDLLFDLDLPKHDLIERKQRFSAETIKETAVQGRPDDANLMQLLNQIAPGRRRGRASDQPSRPLWSLYQTLIIARRDLVRVLFKEESGMFTRKLRPIEQEASDLAKEPHIDALALLYGLVLEALELTDGNRLGVAKHATLAWLPNLYKLPECRRVAPLIELAVARACSKSVSKRFSRVMAFDRVRPGSWRDPGPLVSVEEMVFSYPDNADSLEYLTMRELNIDRMNKMIEDHATSWIPAQPSATRAAKVAANVLFATRFPFRSKRARPLGVLHKLVSAAVTDLGGWKDGRFWVMQRGTRCAVTATGQESFPLMLVDFGHLRGDPVTDRPIPAMPWIVADWQWIESTADLTATSRLVIKFLRRG